MKFAAIKNLYSSTSSIKPKIKSQYLQYAKFMDDPS